MEKNSLANTMLAKIAKSPLTLAVTLAGVVSWYCFCAEKSRAKLKAVLFHLSCVIKELKCLFLFNIFLFKDPSVL